MEAPEAAASRPSPEKVPQMLQLVLQHSPDLSTPRDLCSLLLASSTCRQAVQQARAHCEIDSSQQQFLETAEGLSNIAVWLPAHSGLVSALDLQDIRWPTAATGSIKTLQNILLLALRPCAVAAAAGASSAQPAAAAAGRAVTAAGQPTPPQLQLDCFSLSALATPAVLTVLAGIPVRKLALQLFPEQFTPALCQSLTALSSLQSLQLTCEDLEVTPSTSAQLQRLVTGLTQLQDLSELELDPLCAAHAQGLPASLTSLTVSNTEPEDEDSGGAVNLGHLTALQDLRISTLHGVQLSLPPGVTFLNTSGPVRVSQQGPDGLLNIVQTVMLFPGDCRIFQDLSTLMQLRTVSVAVAGFGLEDAGVEALQACTGLTSLWLNFGSDERKPAASMPWCRFITKLTNLEELSSPVGTQAQSDVLQLSTLTRLTHLNFTSTDGCDDATAVALACNLTNLRNLRLAVRSVAAVPAIGRLTELESLGLVQRPRGSTAVKQGLTPSLLNQLLPLTQLTQLSLPLGRAVCPREARLHFLDQMPNLNNID